MSARWSVRGWLDALAVYRQPRLIAILLMGFSSGLPLALTASTLSFWLAEIGVSLTTIGFFALVGISYNLKFLWSPLIDRLPIPFLTARLGRRRSWALAIQIPLAFAILAMGMTDPRSDPAATAIAAVVVAFLSASQDIVIDAYRIELLLPEEQGAGAAATQWGYRFGLLAASAGALYAAAFASWSFAYSLMAALMLVGMATVVHPEPGQVRNPNNSRRDLVRAAEDMARPGRRGAVRRPVPAYRRRRLRRDRAVYRALQIRRGAGRDDVEPALRLAQLTKPEVANIGKIYGFAATPASLSAAWSSIGSACSSVAGLRDPAASSNLMYAVQVWAGHDVAFLAVTIGYENLTNGMGSAAFVSYLSAVQRRVHRDAIRAVVLAGRRRADDPVGLGRQMAFCSAGRRSSWSAPCCASPACCCCSG